MRKIRNPSAAATATTTTATAKRILGRRDQINGDRDDDNGSGADQSENPKYEWRAERNRWVRCVDYYLYTPLHSWDHGHVWIM
jgi:hypothetical protein